MWLIRALDGSGREVASAELATGEVTIGRDPDRRLVLPATSVSRRHARLCFDGNQLLLVDDGSANGVLVDGLRLGQPTPVDALSRIEIGEFLLTLEPVAVLPSLALLAEGGAYDGRSFSLTATEDALGRHPENRIVLEDASISRRHAKLRRCGPLMLEVEDLGSSNGTYLNGEKLTRGMAKPGDQLRFGDLCFRLQGESPATAWTGIPARQRYGLFAAASLTLLLLGTTVVLWRHLPRPVRTSGQAAIERIVAQAASGLQRGRELLEKGRYDDAKLALDQAIDLDPASLEARRLRRFAVRGPADERVASAAQAKLVVGDRQGLAEALRLREETTAGAPARTRLSARLAGALVSFGKRQCDRQQFADCAWALCRALTLEPHDSPDPVLMALLRRAEVQARSGTCDGIR